VEVRRRKELSKNEIVEDVFEVNVQMGPTAELAVELAVEPAGGPVVGRSVGSAVGSGSEVG
jgi:hypothetical protein